MSFRVAARTILHLGSDLISSDGIAFYELVKNSLDAKSPEVRISVVQRIPFDVYDDILRALSDRRGALDNPQSSSRANTTRWRELRAQALEAISERSPGANRLHERLESVSNKSQFLHAMRRANYIEVDDDGEGMSIETLNEVYLTIGTSHRIRKRNKQRGQRSTSQTSSKTDSIVLGEKGLGRLSAMRLGDSMEVLTGCSGGQYWNRLRINWNDFANAADEEIGSITITPEEHDDKERDVQGTRIRIFSLTSPWSEQKLEDLARDHFSKFVDPFAESRLPLKVLYNGRPVNIPEFASFILEHSHGVFTAKFRMRRNRTPHLAGNMNYRLRGRKRDFDYSGAEVCVMAGDVSRETLARVGAFDLEVYWFNRRVLTKIEGLGDLNTVRKLLAMWAGGVSLYRDGYRVNPYGGPNDDWLDLDRQAFSTSGFKLNRGQIVGRANISKTANPFLTDQTNREGLTDGPEKAAFVSLLAATMEFFRGFIVGVDEDIRQAERVGAEDALERFRIEDDRLETLWPELKDVLSETSHGRSLARKVRRTLRALREAATMVEAAGQAQEEERARVMHLASIGLLIEVLAHELYRATAGGLRTIAATRSGKDSRPISVSLRVLDAQLKTLQKRLKVLDPLSTSARQRKEEFELGDWITEIVEGYAIQNRDAKRIEIRVIVEPKGAPCRVRAVRGMFVQIIENLLSNSVYWIEQQEKYDHGPRVSTKQQQLIGEVTVTLEADAGRIVVADTGPGIPEERRELVFQPFYTTKKQKEGRGLGLYIARQIAEYHGGVLNLGPVEKTGCINSVVLDLGSTVGD